MKRAVILAALMTTGCLKFPEQRKPWCIMLTRNGPSAPGQALALTGERVTVDGVSCSVLEWQSVTVSTTGVKTTFPDDNKLTVYSPVSIQGQVHQTTTGKNSPNISGSGNSVITYSNR